MDVIIRNILVLASLPRFRLTCRGRQRWTVLGGHFSIQVEPSGEWKCEARPGGMFGSEIYPDIWQLNFLSHHLTTNFYLL